MVINAEINDLIGRTRLRKWEIAEKIGISASTFSVWLRTPLTEDRKRRVLNAVHSLLAETQVTFEL